MDFTKMDDNEMDDDDESSMVPENVDQLDEENSDDDSDNDDDEEEEDEAKIVAEINRLQDELRHDPNNYDNHVSLISKLKMIGELECLREAREKMNRVYPLSPELWLEWIEDEKGIGTTEEQQQEILKLFQRAVSEYLNINLWMEYIQYCIEQMSSLGIDGIRKIMDQALNQGGLHVASGSLFWGIYRDIESSHLDTIAEHSKNEIRNSIEKIYDLYCRQLSLPLIEVGDTIAEFEQWIDSIKGKYQIDLRQEQKDYGKIQSKHEKAKKKLDQLKQYEIKLAVKEDTNLQTYLDYLELEKREGDLARTLCLYERAVAENCLHPELWLQYLQYCDGKLVIADILLPIYERAVRNCFWEPRIWIRYMEAVERLNNGTSVKEEVKMILERALKSISMENHRELWLAYLHCVRRHTNFDNTNEKEQLRQSFLGAIGQLEPYQGVDHCYEIYRYLAKVEARFCSNVEGGRNAWKEFLEKSESLKFQATTWIEYVNFEQWHGNEIHLADAGLKALQLCSDYPETVAELFLRLERESGSDIGHYYQSSVKYEKALKRIQEKRAKQQSNEVKKDGSCATKRKAAADENNNASGKPKAKKAKTETAPTNHGESVKTDESKRQQTVFVSNLNFEVDENELREKFAQIGPVQDVRLVRNYKGLSKGFGYVEFETIDGAREALKHDRMLVRQRPVFISEMDKKKTFDYRKSKEENKLFVKNIPPDITTKEQLVERIFAEYRDYITDARLVTYRNGYSKGIAFVEMKDAEMAANAVKEKDGMEIAPDRKLFVAISDPSRSEKKTTEPPSIGRTKAAAKPASSMVPHSVVMRVRSKPSKVKIQVGGDDPVSSNSAGKEPMSNNQFRSMFLNNK